MDKKVGVFVEERYSIEKVITKLERAHEEIAIRQSDINHPKSPEWTMSLEHRDFRRGINLNILGVMESLFPALGCRETFLAEVQSYSHNVDGFEKRTYEPDESS